MAKIKKALTFRHVAARLLFNDGQTSKQVVGMEVK